MERAAEAASLSLSPTSRVLLLDRAHLVLLLSSERGLSSPVVLPRSVDVALVPRRRVAGRESALGASISPSFRFLSAPESLLGSGGQNFHVPYFGVGAGEFSLALERPVAVDAELVEAELEDVELAPPPGRCQPGGFLISGCDLPDDDKLVVILSSMNSVGGPIGPSWAFAFARASRVRCTSACEAFGGGPAGGRGPPAAGRGLA